MIIKKIIQEAKYEDIEITFPFYRVVEDLFYYYVKSENEIYCITDSKVSKDIKIELQTTLYINNVFHLNSDYIDKKAWDIKYQKAIQVFDALLEKY